jgi:hypothetical protein
MKIMTISDVGGNGKCSIERKRERGRGKYFFTYIVEGYINVAIK